MHITYVQSGLGVFYSILIIFVILQSVVILLLVRRLKANKKTQMSMAERKENPTEDKIRQEELTCTIRQLMALNSLKDRLFTVVTHDIRTPMATMVSLVELLEEDYHFGENKEIIYEVRKYVNDTFFMVESLLESLKNQKAGIDYIDLSRVALETVKMLQNNPETKGIRIINNMEESVAILSDKEIIGLVMGTFLDNAMQLTCGGGLISIQILQTGENVIFTVRNSGIGIDSDKIKALFSEVHTGYAAVTPGEKGAGLGTLISSECEKFSGDEGWMKSIHGKSGTFYFCLPCEGEGYNLMGEKKY